MKRVTSLRRESIGTLPPNVRGMFAANRQITRIMDYSVGFTGEPGKVGRGTEYVKMNQVDYHTYSVEYDATAPSVVGPMLVGFTDRRDGAVSVWL